MKQKTLKILSIALMISMTICCFSGNTMSKQISSLEAAGEVDQSQTYCNNSVLLGNITEELGVKIAQSFKPEKEILTSVQVLLGRNIVAHKPCSVAIREELDGEDLAYTNVSFEDIPIADVPVNLSNLTWVEFNFDDISVNTSRTYYLVVYSDPALLLNFFAYGYVNESLYENGTLYELDIIPDVNTAWEDTTFDLCFKTFGADEGQADVIVEDVVGSFLSKEKGVIVKVKNSGSANATDVVVKINITGGLMGLINAETSVTMPRINVSEVKEIQANAFGLGRVNINVTVGDENILRSGFIFFKKIFVIPDLFA